MCDAVQWQRQRQERKDQRPNRPLPTHTKLTKEEKPHTNSRLLSPVYATLTSTVRVVVCDGGLFVVCGGAQCDPSVRFSVALRQSHTDQTKETTTTTTKKKTFNLLALSHRIVLLLVLFVCACDVLLLFGLEFVVADQSGIE